MGKTGCPHASPPHYGHQPVIRPSGIANLFCLEVAVLKPGGSDQRRRVNELSHNPPTGRAACVRPPTRIDTLLTRRSAARVVDDPLQLSDRRPGRRTPRDPHLLFRSRAVTRAGYPTAGASGPEGGPREPHPRQLLAESASAVSKEPRKSYSRDPDTECSSAPGAVEELLALVLQRCTHSFLQTESDTPSADMTKIIPCRS